MKKLLALPILLGVLGVTLLAVNYVATECNPCAGWSAKTMNYQVLVQNGVRPHWNLAGTSYAYDTYFSATESGVITSTYPSAVFANVTHGKAGVPQTIAGNAVYDTTGQYLVFQVEAVPHFAGTTSTDPGFGTYANLWAAKIDGSQFWELTNIPIMQTDGVTCIPAEVPCQIHASLNPVFNANGTKLAWSERYSGADGLIGNWRIHQADWAVVGGVPTISNETIPYTSATRYVTTMGYINPATMIISGNPDGQSPYAMDVYLMDWATGTFTKNLTNSPLYWEEGATPLPDGTIMFMSNRNSPCTFNFSNPDAFSQPMTRNLNRVNQAGTYYEQLTFVDQSQAKEYQSQPTMLTNMSVHDLGGGLLNVLTTMSTNFTGNPLPACSGVVTLENKVLLFQMVPTAGVIRSGKVVSTGKVQ